MPRTQPTSRQGAVLRLVAEGATNAEIAARLGIDLNTVKGHVAQASRTLGARTRAHAAVLWDRQQPAVDRQAPRGG